MDPILPQPDYSKAVNPFAAGKRAARIRSILWTAGVLIVAIMAVFIYTRSRKSALLILESQDHLTVTLNGQPATILDDKRGLYIPVYNGQFRLEISKPDYLPYIQDILVEPGKTISIRPTFTLLPAANSAESTAANNIAFVRPDPEEKVVYYLGDGRSRLYRVEAANQVHIPLTEKPLTNVRDVEWSSDPRIALIVLSDGTYLQEIPKFDFTTQQVIKIAGPELLSPVWDPNNTNRIAAAYFTGSGEHSLILADKRLTQIDRKADLTGFVNPRLIWSPDSRYIAIVPRSSNPGENNIWIYTLADGNFQQLTTSGLVIDASFNFDSSYLLEERLAENGEHILQTIKLSDKALSSQTVPGTVAASSWKSNSSYLTPQSNENAIVEYFISGASNQIPFTFPSKIEVRGLIYYGQSNTLIFYSEQAVYTVSLAT